MDNRKKEFLESRRSNKKETHKKTDYERRQTREEVEQIKKDLINYAKTSWGKEWIYSNLQIGRPFRMQRGIDYANDETRINNVSISNGQIFATVQGTAPTPYRIKINFETLSEEEWGQIIKNVSERPLSLIELLQGNLPIEMSEFFEEGGHSLFPNALKGLEATCSCPDKAIPCKHIASVILYLSRIIDFNPFLLLRLKGKSKNEFLEDLSLKKFPENSQLNHSLKYLKIESLKFNIPKISKLEDRSQKGDEITLNFNIKKPTKIIETIDNLGAPYNLENKEFEIVLKALYRYVSSKSFEISGN